jgi:hypothetical protein
MGGTFTTVYNTIVSNAHPFSVWISPIDLAVYFSDAQNNKIYKIVTQNNPSPTPELLAGTGSSGYGSEGTPGLSTTFTRPHGIYGASNYLYVCDTINFVVRKVSLINVNAAVATIGKNSF